MEVVRVDGRKTCNDLRPINFIPKPDVLHRPHGSARWAQGDTIVLAAVYGPKPGTKKNQNPEKPSIEVIWNPKTGHTDAGIPLTHLAVAISCGLDKTGSVLLDPTKLEEQTMQAFTYLVFPNTFLSVLPEASLQVEGEKMEHGLITSVTHGVMSVDGYFHCLARGRTASAAISNLIRRRLQPQTIH